MRDKNYSIPDPIKALDVLLKALEIFVRILQFEFDFHSESLNFILIVFLFVEVEILKFAPLQIVSAVSAESSTILNAKR